LKKYNPIRLAVIITFMLISLSIKAQPITGVWKGKLRSARIELKLIKKGDSLVGTSYYYESKNNYRRYTVKGYFDDETNNVVWWDDVLIDDKSSFGAKDAMMAVADFNCPGEEVMKLDGNSSPRDTRDAAKIPLSLQKVSSPVFDDEWNFVLDNYTLGANNPEIIDSVAQIAIAPVPVPPGYEAAPLSTTVNQTVSDTRSRPVVTAVPVKEYTKTEPNELTDEQKFATRTKTLQTVIPVTGDSIELRFYDDAEIDGDSIAVFLNNKLLWEHIGLTDQAYTKKIALHDLEDDNELVIVAENLGSIPPNTSLMIVMVGVKRYEARLQSTEVTSALVRFVKEIKK